MRASSTDQRQHFQSSGILLHHRQPPRKYLDMSLNDPFGRLAQKDKIQYASLSKALQEEGVNTREIAEARIKTLVKRTSISAAVVIGLAFLLAFLVPNLKPVAGLFGIVIVAWLATTTAKGMKFIRLYIKSELEKPQPTDD